MVVVVVVVVVTVVEDHLRFVAAVADPHHPEGAVVVDPHHLEGAVVVDLHHPEVEGGVDLDHPPKVTSDQESGLGSQSEAVVHLNRFFINVKKYSCPCVFGGKFFTSRCKLFLLRSCCRRG